MLLKEDVTDTASPGMKAIDTLPSSVAMSSSTPASTSLCGGLSPAVYRLHVPLLLEVRQQLDQAVIHSKSDVSLPERRTAPNTFNGDDNVQHQQRYGSPLLKGVGPIGAQQEAEVHS